MDQALAPIASDRVELSAFTPYDNRDLTGFIDGTENPLIDEALEVALYGEGPGEGGSIVLVQKWVHNLSAFYSLSEKAQEEVFGRTRADSVQLSDADMPATSHVSRNTIHDAAGEELHIFRRNTPFASLAEAGTMYIGASCDPSRTDRMLQRMFGASGDGGIDMLTRFSTAVSGAYYFVPSMDALTRVFGSLDSEDDEAAPAPAPASTSLGIGSLRM